MQLLFEGGVYFAQSFRLCSYYSRAAFILPRASGYAVTIRGRHLFCSELPIMQLLFKGSAYAWACLIKDINTIFVCNPWHGRSTCDVSHPFAFPPQEPASISRSGSSGSNISDASLGSRELLQEGSSGHLYVVTPERHHTVGSSDVESSFPGR